MTLCGRKVGDCGRMWSYRNISEKVKKKGREDGTLSAIYRPLKHSHTSSNAL